VCYISSRFVFNGQKSVGKKIKSIRKDVKPQRFRKETYSFSFALSLRAVFSGRVLIELAI